MGRSNKKVTGETKKFSMPKILKRPPTSPIRAVLKGFCPPEAFEEGFVAIAEIIDDVLYDVLYDFPKALDVFSIALKGDGLKKSRLSI